MPAHRHHHHRRHIVKPVLSPPSSVHACPVEIDSMLGDQPVAPASALDRPLVLQSATTPTSREPLLVLDRLN